MEMKIYDKNINATLEIEKTKKGEDYTLIIEKDQEKKYVLSKYNPITTAQQLVGEEFGNKETIWIVLGYALGYTIDYIVSKVGKEAKILVIEPNDYNLEFQQKCRLIKEAKRVNFFCGKDFMELRTVFRRIIGRSEIGNIKLIQHSVYSTIYEEYYTEVVKILREAILQGEVDYNTDEAFNNLFITNVIKNRRHITNSLDIRQHYNKYQGVPAVIVSAGPSLDKNIEYIKDFQGIIITGGRTLGDILDNGKRPDFLVSIDPQPIAYDLLGEHKCNDFPLITVAASEPQVIETHEGPEYFVDHGGYNHIVKQFLGIGLPYVTMGASVATLCLSAAHYMGCNPIIFIGQDLAHTDFNTHAASQQGNVEANINQTYYYVEGYNEKKVPTTSVLMSFLRWIEQFIEENPNRVYINATEGGAKIKGTKQIPFREVIEEYREAVTINHEVVHLCNEIDTEDRLESARRELNRFKALANVGINMTNKILNEYKGTPPRLHVIDQLSLDINNIITKQIDKMNAQNPGLGIIINHANTKLNQMNKYKEKIEETSIEANMRGVKRQKRFYMEIVHLVNELLDMIDESEK